MDHTAIILFALQGVGVLFMLWMRADGSSQRVALKLELKKEQDEKIEFVQHEYASKMEELRNRMEARMIDAIRDQFVRLDVYKSDREANDRRFDMLQQVVNLQLGNISNKLDDIVKRLERGV